MSADILQARSANPRRRLTILGSTGSVGRSTLDLVGRNAALYEIEALTAYENVALLADQARTHRARLAVIGDPALYDALMAAIVGSAGLEPTLAAITRGATVALANKECLVCAGDLVMKAVARHGATLLPVDSEHNAIFQVFDFAHPETVDRLILTASGGPFRRLSLAEMRDVTPAQAVAHPNWSMGAKISVDSATLMNKGLELIEASYLFPVAEERIEILVHPQSVVHSLVAYVDGSVLAQLGPADMRTPIAYTLAWPERMRTPCPRLDLAALTTLSFESPDPVRFPALSLTRHALQSGGAAPTILNAANEAAVAGFLAGRIGFLDIARIVERALEQVPRHPVDTLDAVQAADRAARAAANRLIADLT